ncbi:MAG: hypothetical protein LBU51_06025 [Bacteroidales bacterium]|jgi:hypothetical protein|nr:hypothetical protein [Bacteroidales bacterium]
MNKIKEKTSIYIMSSLYENYNRYHFVANKSLGDLYAAEKNLKELRFEIGL